MDSAIPACILSELQSDLLIHAGGFGVIALDLCDVPLQVLCRIPVSSWYRFRRAVAGTPYALILLSRDPQARYCASLRLEMKRTRSEFVGTTPVHKPVNPRSATFEAMAVE